MSLLHLVDPVALQAPAFGLFGREFAPGVHWYGLMYALAFLSAWLLGRSRIRAGRLPGVDEAGFGDLMFYGMLGVVLGGASVRGVFSFGDSGHSVLRCGCGGGQSFHGGLWVLRRYWFWWRCRAVSSTLDSSLNAWCAGAGSRPHGQRLGGECGSAAPGPRFRGALHWMRSRGRTPECCTGGKAGGIARLNAALRS